MLTPDALTRLAARPEIRSSLPCDWTQQHSVALLSHPRHIVMGDERGVAIFAWKAPGVYSGHYWFSDALRGRAALLEAKKFISALFTTHHARVIKGAVPRSHRASRAMTRALGFRPVGTSTDTQGQPCLDYIMDRESWAQHLATSLEPEQT